MTVLFCTNIEWGNPIIMKMKIAVTMITFILLLILQLPAYFQALSPAFMDYDRFHSQVIQYEVYHEVREIVREGQVRHSQYIHNHSRFNTHAVKKPTFPESEYNALKFLYNTTNGENWRWLNTSGGWIYDNHTHGIPYHVVNLTANSIPWNFTRYGVNNPCTDNWQGVVCSCTATTCHVTQLDLDQHNITGTLPAQFFNLNELIFLSFRKNNITGSLPSSMSTSQKLIAINLEANAFTGILDNWWGDLTDLLYLGISRNAFTNFSSGFFDLPRLQFLDMAFNDFEGSFPADFGNYFPNMRELLIGGNRFTGTIPLSFANFTQFRGFDAEINDFAGPFPSVLCQLINITGLSLGTNRFTGTIPECITNLTLLTRVLLSRNDFFGSLPQNLDNCPDLIFFNLDENLFSGSLPHSLSKLRKLRTLLLFENSFTGVISSENFPVTGGPLALIYFQHNFFHGSITHLFDNFPLIIYFVCAFNQFSGLLPMSHWPEMYEYFLDHNYLTGTIPLGFQNITRLRFFYVDANYLTGTIPTPFISSEHIANINMSTNALTGTLPKSLSSLTVLDQLLVDNNFFTGTLPESFANLRELIVLSISYNRFTGTIPKTYESFILLQELFAEHNQFTGNIEQAISITNQRFIVNVDLSDNRFTGTLSGDYFLNKSDSLQTFSVSLNCLSGSIPDEICQVSSLTVLSLDGLTTAENCRNYIFPLTSSTVNTFTSKRFFQQTIPSCLFHMPNLISLHMSGNGLTGTLPTNVSLSETLTDLSLSHNSLTGSIPQIIQKRSWTNLDLSYNKLTGILNDDCFKISDNGSLSLEVNRLSGKIPPALLHLSTISILNGNLFDCDNTHSVEELPQNDPQAKNYNCGSNAANYAIYSFLATTTSVVGVLVILLLTWKKALSSPRQRSSVRRSERAKASDIVSEQDLTNDDCHNRKEDNSDARTQEEKKEEAVSVVQRIQNVLTLLALWRQTLQQRPKSSNLFFLHVYFQQVRWLFIQLTLFCLFVLLPVYVAFAPFFSAYTYQYAWLLSGVLNSGETPVIVIILLYGLLIFWFVYLLRQVMTLIELHRIQHQGRYSLVINRIQLNRYDRLIYVMIGAVNILVMGVIDISYVFVALNASSTVIIVTSLGLALVRLLNNNLLLWHFLRTVAIRYHDYSR